MNLQFLGAAREVTGSCFLLEALGKNIIVDCGLEQGKDIYENQEIPVAPQDVDIILLTHAHIDHSGMVPMLVAKGFKGPIYATTSTMELCDIMLKDSAHIQEFEAEWRNRKAKRAGQEEYVPLYTVQDAIKTMELFIPVDYEVETTIAPGLVVKYTDAGHLLGSASITISISEGGTTKKIVFSGDIGNTNQPMLNDPILLKNADYVVMESTYGDRSHGPRTDYITDLTNILQTTFDAGGNVVIPSFAVGRTQELLYFFREIKEKNLLKNYDGFEVYVDSPLAIEATNIFKQADIDHFDDEMRELINKGINPISFPGLKASITSDDSKAINENKKPKVIISASGMANAGRIRHHLKHNLWRKESTILFVGYQAEGTLGRKIYDGAEFVKLFGETIEVKAKIRTLNAISGHADNEGLMAWAKSFSPKPIKFFIVHGDEPSAETLADRLVNELGLDVAVPYNGEKWDLKNKICVLEGNKEYIQKYTEAKIEEKRFSSLYRELLKAEARLHKIIENSSGLANGLLKKFVKQIEKLCEYWEQ
ncbi:MAG: MBL fold metallo-hydrolase [Christensenellaceae bacterium]|nr:MBL fold metallo-hydrolase [Christensenellaceae bacterium]